MSHIRIDSIEIKIEPDAILDRYRFVEAVAEVRYDSHDGKFIREEHLHSLGRGNVENDSECIRTAVDAQLDDLKTHLEVFGVDTSDFGWHAQQAKGEM